MFWIWIIIVTLVIVGVSVVVGKAVSRPPSSGGNTDRRQQNMNALKASGALKYRKSNRD